MVLFVCLFFFNNNNNGLFKSVAYFNFPLQLTENGRPGRPGPAATSRVGAALLFVHVTVTHHCTEGKTARGVLKREWSVIHTSVQVCLRLCRLPYLISVLSLGNNVLNNSKFLYSQFFDYLFSVSPLF